MTEHVASRTLVKSPPELWAECSDAASLARHLDRFGEIRITRLDPETAVAWEGERARGTVRIEPAGWGTKVILTAVAEDTEGAEPRQLVVPPEPERVVAPEPERIVAPEPEAAEEPEPEPVVSVETRGRAARARRAGSRSCSRSSEAPSRWWSAAEGPVEPEPEPEPESPVLDAPQPELEPGLEREPEPEPEPPTTDTPATEAALTAALDSLGQAHHRPYSRA